MLLIKEGNLSPNDLTPEEIRCLRQRVKTRMWKPDHQAVAAKALWASISTSGTGSTYNKRMMLFAWPIAHIVYQHIVFASCCSENDVAVVV